MKKVFTSKELLTIDEILNKYGSDSDTTVTDFELDLLTKLYEDYQHLVRHIDKTEDENRRLHNSINLLRAANSNQSHEIHKLEKQLTDITILYHEAHDYIADFEESEDRCATLEAENEKLKEQVKGLHKECRCDTLVTLEAENNRFRNTIKNMNENFREHLNNLEAENHDLKDKLDIVSENLNNHIIELKDKLYKADEENKKLKEKVGELHTIKKSFDVLRCLYLGDYENDEPF